MARKRPGIRRSRVRTMTHQKLHGVLHPSFAAPQIAVKPASKENPNGLRARFYSWVRSLAAKYMKAGL